MDSYSYYDNSEYGSGDHKTADYKYEYPKGWDLKPGSTLHERLKTHIINRARASHSAMSARYPSWRDMDKQVTVYMPLSEEEKKRKGKDVREPVAIVVPLMYAMRETLLTFLIATFLDRPIFRYEAVGPEDVLGAKLLELIIDLHCHRSKVGLPLHTSFSDGLTYGIGIVAPYWETRRGKRIEREMVSEYDEVTDEYRNVARKKTVETTLFEGNALYNIDPYMYFPDPNISAHEVQRGEFVAWARRDNFMNLLSQEQEADSTLFNVQYLKNVSTGFSSLFGQDQSERDKYGVEQIRSVAQATKPIDIIYMHWTLIPADMGLGNSDRPEKWLFELAADEIIIRAEPLDLNHNMFPVAVCAPDYDGYSPTPMSRLEVAYDSHETINWLINNQIEYLLENLSGRVVYDPYWLNPNDMEARGPGKQVRTQRQFFGRGVVGSFQELNIRDSSGANIANAGYLTDIIMQTTGATPSVSGIMRSGGERRSATEARTTFGSAISKLEKLARIISIQQLQDIGYIFASHAQQFMTKDLVVRTTGRWEQTLREIHGKPERFSVSPLDIAVDYDVQVRDSTVPSGEYADVWTTLFQIMAKYPQLSQQFDMVRIFMHIARMMGAKNLHEFTKAGGSIRAETATPEQIEKQLAAGDIRPLEGFPEGMEVPGTPVGA